MKTTLLTWIRQDGGETIATFGDARLVKRLTGKLELVGGTDQDRAAAKEWASLFLPEVSV